MSVVFSENFHFVPQKDQHVYIMAHPNSTSQHMLQHGIFEKELIEQCKSMSQSVQSVENGKVFLDIGAHIGSYTINLARYFAHTYAFEAQKSTYYMLCGNVALNDLSKIVTTKHCALSNYENDGKMLTLNIVSADGGGSSVKLLNESVIETESVISKPLDYFQIENIGLIKMDVEGGELDVLKGALQTLEKSHYPPILFEAWSDFWYQEEKNKIFAFLAEIGYKIQPAIYSNMFLAQKE